MEDQFRRERHLGAKHEYSPFTRIGNWSEDICEEEEELYKLLLSDSKGIVKLNVIKPLLTSALRRVELTQNLDGFLHDGDVIMFKTFGDVTDLPRYLCALPALPSSHDPADGKFKSPCAVGATVKPWPVGRTAFIIYRQDNRISNKVPIMYGESISIYTPPFTGSLKLHSETKTVLKFARKSKNQEVELVNESSANTSWKIIYKDPQYRMEMEGMPVPVNTEVIVNHSFTNQNLAVESEHTIRSIFGVEKEVSAHSYYDKYKVEEMKNIWRITTPLANPKTFDIAVQLPAQERVNPGCHYDVIPPPLTDA